MTHRAAREGDFVARCAALGIRTKYKSAIEIGGRPILHHGFIRCSISACTVCDAAGGVYEAGACCSAANRHFVVYGVAAERPSAGSIYIDNCAILKDEMVPFCTPCAKGDAAVDTACEIRYPIHCEGIVPHVPRIALRVDLTA